MLQCRCRRSAVFASPSSRCSTWLTLCRPLPSYGSSSLASILMFRRTNVGSGAGVVVAVRDLSVWFPIQQINPSYLPGGSNVHASTQHVVVCDLSVWFPIQQINPSYLPGGSNVHASTQHVVVCDLSVWFPIQQINPSYLPGGSNVHASTQHVVVCDLSVRFPIQQSRLVFASPQTTQSFSPIHPAYHSDRPNPKTIHSFFPPSYGGWHAGDLILF